MGGGAAISIGGCRGMCFMVGPGCCWDPNVGSSPVGATSCPIYVRDTHTLCNYIYNVRTFVHV